MTLPFAVGHCGIGFPEEEEEELEELLEPDELEEEELDELELDIELQIVASEAEII